MVISKLKSQEMLPPCITEEEVLVVDKYTTINNYTTVILHDGTPQIRSDKELLLVTKNTKSRAKELLNSNNIKIMRDENCILNAFASLGLGCPNGVNIDVYAKDREKISTATDHDSLIKEYNEFSKTPAKKNTSPVHYNKTRDTFMTVLSIINLIISEQGPTAKFSLIVDVESYGVLLNQRIAISDIVDSLVGFGMLRCEKGLILL